VHDRLVARKLLLLVVLGELAVPSCDIASKLMCLVCLEVLAGATLMVLLRMLVLLLRLLVML